MASQYTSDLPACDVFPAYNDYHAREHHDHTKCKAPHGIYDEPKCTLEQCEKANVIREWIITHPTDAEGIKTILSDVDSDLKEMVITGIREISHTVKWIIDGCDMTNLPSKYYYCTTKQVLDVFDDGNGEELSSRFLSAAAIRGDIEYAEYLIARGCPLDDRAAGFAAKYGYADFVQWAIENKCPLTAETLRIAASGGNCRCIKILLTAGCVYDDRALNNAGQEGHIDAVFLLLTGRILNKRPAELCRIARLRRWDMVLLLCKNGCPLNSGVFNGIVATGNIELIDQLLEIGRPFDEYTCSYSAEKGDIQMLEKLRQHGAPLNELAWKDAAENGHAECLIYLRDNGCPPTPFWISQSRYNNDQDKYSRVIEITRAMNDDLANHQYIRAPYTR
jgi:hypothetical protein